MDTSCLAPCAMFMDCILQQRSLLKMSISSYSIAGPSIFGDEFCLIALRDLSDLVTSLVTSAQIFPTGTIATRQKEIKSIGVSKPAVPAFEQHMLPLIFFNDGSINS